MRTFACTKAEILLVFMIVISSFKNDKSLKNDGCGAS